jgi:hypothetical protein
MPSTLSAAERNLLQDPDWIAEDEADAIIAERIYRREAGPAKPLREYLRERGIPVGAHICGLRNGIY